MSRTHIPKRLRREIETQFYKRCSYCQIQQSISGVSLTIDHIVPESLDGKTMKANLSLACWDCNLIKSQRTHGFDIITQSIVSLFHPQQQIWSEHFRWSEDGTLIIGITPTGRATVQALKLNRIELIESRKLWVAAGWHPPY